MNGIWISQQNSHPNPIYTYHQYMQAPVHNQNPTDSIDTIDSVGTLDNSRYYRDTIEILQIHIDMNVYCILQILQSDDLVAISTIPGHRRRCDPLGGAEAPQPAAAVGSQQRASELPTGPTGKSHGKRWKILWKMGNVMENPSRKLWEDGKIIRKTLEKMNSRGFFGKIHCKWPWK